MASDIPEGDAIQLVSEAITLNFDEIAVTGGEPLLRKPLVLQLAHLCLQKNQPFGLITNGFWASTKRKAAKC